MTFRLNAVYKMFKISNIIQFKNFNKIKDEFYRTLKRKNMKESEQFMLFVLTNQVTYKMLIEILTIKRHNFYRMNRIKLLFFFC